MTAKPEIIKQGRRKLGVICETSSGHKVYLAYRRVRDIHCAGEKCIADAIRKGTAAWAIEDEVILKARAVGCAFIGVLVQDTGDRYLAPAASFFKPGAYRTIKVFGRSGTQRALPFPQFARRAGKIVKRR